MRKIIYDQNLIAELERLARRSLKEDADLSEINRARRVIHELLPLLGLSISKESRELMLTKIAAAKTTISRSSKLAPG